MWNIISIQFLQLVLKKKYFILHKDSVIQKQMLEKLNPPKIQRFWRCSQCSKIYFQQIGEPDLMTYFSILLHAQLTFCMHVHCFGMQECPGTECFIAIFLMLWWLCKSLNAHETDELHFEEHKSFHNISSINLLVTVLWLVQSNGYIITRSNINVHCPILGKNMQLGLISACRRKKKSQL